MAILPARHRPTFILVALLVFTLFLFLSNLRDGRGFAILGKELFSFTAHIQKTLGVIISFPALAWERYINLVRAADTNRRLGREVDKLRQENASLRELSLSAKRLRDLLEFKDTSSFRLVAAQVIGVDASAYFKSVIIDKGQKAGIKKAMAVISPAGVVGRILKVTDSFSMVLLLVDENFALDALDQRSRAGGVVEGFGGSLCHMKYVLHLDDIRPRDLVVASGLEGIFPKGAIIGGVVSVKSGAPSAFKDIIIKPSVDFGRLEEVLVVTEH